MKKINVRQWDEAFNNHPDKEYFKEVVEEEKGLVIKKKYTKYFLMGKEIFTKIETSFIEEKEEYSKGKIEYYMSEPLYRKFFLKL